MTGLRDRFQFGIAWNVGGTLATQASNFITSIIIANLLGRVSYGKYGIVQSTLLTTAGIAQIATGITATKYVAEFRTTNRDRAGNILGLCSVVTGITGLLATLFLFLAAPWLARETLGSPELSSGLRLSAGFLFFSVANGYQMGALGGLEAFKALTIAGGIQGALQVIICGAATWIWGISGAFAGLVVASFVRWLSYNVAINTEARNQGIVMRYSGIRTEATVLSRFAIPAALSGFSSPPALWLGNAFLIRQPDGFSQMAAFAAALNLKNIVMFLPIILNRVGTSLLNNQKGEGDQRRYQKVFWYNAAFTGGSALFFATIIGLAGHHLLRLYGRSYLEAYPVLIVLLVAACLDSIALANYQIVQARERMWGSLLATVLPKDLALIIAAYYLVPAHAAMGLGYAHLIWAVVNVATVSVLVSVLGLKFNRDSDNQSLVSLLKSRLAASPTFPNQEPRV